MMIAWVGLVGLVLHAAGPFYLTKRRRRRG
jgi:hypothetical protein